MTAPVVPKQSMSVYAGWGGNYAGRGLHPRPERSTPAKYLLVLPNLESYLLRVNFFN